MHRTTVVLVALSGLLVTGVGYSQTNAPPNPTQQRVTQPQGEVPVYRVTVVGRSTPAINYRYRSGDTPIDFEGTPLLPRAKGRANVETKKGYSDIDAHFGALEPATKFGPEYLTYVLWAITPEGRATNLGEILLNGDDSKLHVTTDLQAFGLVVTAEPYFAVTQPSDVVVLENRVRPETVGAVERVEAKYELLKRGAYVMNVAPNRFTQRPIDASTPLELREARNAVDLSRAAGADRYAAETFQKAATSLEQSEDYQAKHRGTKPVIMTARAAAQMAEDARLIAVQRQLEQQANDAAARHELELVVRARDEGDRARKAEAERAAAEDARARAEATADRLTQEKTEAEAARARAEQTAEQLARAKAEAEQASARNARDKADADAARAAAERAKADAERAAQDLANEKARADAARAASAADAERARTAVQQAEQEKAALRAKLQQQLNIVLETRETARGLIVNMSDVLFDSGKATLRPGAREKLAKVAGILLAYPGLSMQIEGHTDSVGAADYNQELSERRANAVRSFLIEQGISTGTVVARGLGKTQPVATNGTAAGRQQNRRVELIVSGDPIGLQ
jgi:outer membrane protein OmpA-like peptidoglycan-associated protein